MIFPQSQPRSPPRAANTPLAGHEGMGHAGCGLQRSRHEDSARESRTSAVDDTIGSTVGLNSVAIHQSSLAVELKTAPTSGRIGVVVGLTTATSRSISYQRTNAFRADTQQSGRANGCVRRLPIRNSRGCSALLDRLGRLPGGRLLAEKSRAVTRALRQRALAPSAVLVGLRKKADECRPDTVL